MNVLEVLMELLKRLEFEEGTRAFGAMESRPDLRVRPDIDGRATTEIHGVSVFPEATCIRIGEHAQREPAIQPQWEFGCSCKAGSCSLRRESACGSSSTSRHAFSDQGLEFWRKSTT